MRSHESAVSPPISARYRLYARSIARRPDAAPSSPPDERADCFLTRAGGGEGVLSVPSADNERHSRRSDGAIKIISYLVAVIVASPR